MEVLLYEYGSEKRYLKTGFFYDKLQCNAGIMSQRGQDQTVK